MAQDEATSRKEKKALRDADRQKKGKKRKHEDIEENGKVEEQNELQKDFLPLDSGAGEEKAKVSKKKSKKESSRKRKLDEVEAPEKLAEQNGDAEPTKTKSKKRKKTTPEAATGEAPAENESPVDKAHRFILFVGNLPYKTSDAALRTHFKSLEPFTLRHRTEPKMGKSKGFAFLEFENYDRMKTCLKLYHHSMFDPEKAEAGVDEADAEGEGRHDKKAKKVKDGKHARRINVELTAGGGGKAEGRKEKIRVKNERLGEQRQRRADAEKKEREKKAKEDGEANGVEPAKKKQKKTKIVEETNVGGEALPDVHPSRLARIAA